MVSRGTSVRIRFGSPFSSKVVVCGHGLVTLSLTVMKRAAFSPEILQAVAVKGSRRDSAPHSE